MTAFHHTLDQLSELKLNGFKVALLQQLENPSFSAMTFEERLSHLINSEITERHNRKIKHLISRSHPETSGSSLLSLRILIIPHPGISRKAFCYHCSTTTGSKLIKTSSLPAQPVREKRIWPALWATTLWQMDIPFSITA